MVEPGLRATLARMVAEATDGDVTAADALAGRAPLPALGMTSLAYVRLIDAVEDRFGVTLDLEGDLSYLDSLDALAARLAASGVPADG